MYKYPVNSSINDGLYIDYNKFSNYTNPKHISFSFFIPNTTSNKEVCNLRLTNISYEALLNYNFRTNVSNYDI